MVRGRRVHAVAVLEQVEGLGQMGPHQSGVGFVAVQFVLNGGEFAGHPVLLLLEQLQWDGAGVVGLEEPAALVLQVGAPGGQGADVAVAVLLDALQLGQQVALDGSAVGVTELDGLVQVGDALFHCFDEDGAEGAVVGAVAAGADEVRVDDALAVLGVLHQEALAAQAADDGGLEVVVVDSFPLAVAMGVQDVLDLLPGGGVDQGLVPAGVLHALEGDDALVVGMAQQVLQASRGDGLSRLVRRRRCCQAQAGQVLGQGADRPVAGGVLGEGQSHERRAFGVELDGADLVALGVAGADVAVAQGRLAVGAAVPGLLAHSLDDLIGQVPAVELGDGAHDAVQQDAAGGLVDVLGGGHQTDTGLVEGPVDLHVVSTIAGQAVELVDDDVVNATGILEIAEHPLQLRAIGAAGGLAAIDELLDDQGAHAGGLLLVGLSLGGDGEALLGSAALGLLAGGDPDVGHGPLGCQLGGHGGEGVWYRCLW